MLRRTTAVAVITATLAGAAACGGERRPGFFGHWASQDRGEHYIVVEGSSVRIVYARDGGRVVGELDGDTVTGWWTQEPTRQPPLDAGQVTFTLAVVDGVPVVDGVWRHGAAGPLREDWDLTWVQAQIPMHARHHFEERAAFIPHP